MHWRPFLAGAALASVVTISAATWLLSRVKDEAILWPRNTFYDDGETQPGSGYVAVEGALTGEDMAGGTFLRVECTVEDRLCRIVELQSLSGSGSPKVVSLHTDSFPIRSADANTIVAESNPPPGVCNRVRLVIVRASRTAQYVRIPQPGADAEACKLSVKKVFTWTIGVNTNSGERE